MNRDAHAPSGGFTLVELLAVVAIFAVAASLAIWSVGKGVRTLDVDNFTNNVSVALMQARNQAVRAPAGTFYLVDVRASSVQWCQTTSAAQTACPSAGLPSGALIQAGPGAAAVNWAKDVDRGQNMTKLAVPAQLYFMSSPAPGAADADLSTAFPLLEGFTLYVQGVDDANQKRKLVVYPFGGRARITDSW